MQIRKTSVTLFVRENIFNPAPLWHACPWSCGFCLCFSSVKANALTPPQWISSHELYSGGVRWQKKKTQIHNETERVEFQQFLFLFTCLLSHGTIFLPHPPLSLMIIFLLKLNLKLKTSLELFVSYYTTSGSCCFPDSFHSQFILECESMLFPVQLKGRWGYKVAWLIVCSSDFLRLRTKQLGRGRVGRGYLVKLLGT